METKTRPLSITVILWLLIVGCGLCLLETALALADPQARSRLVHAPVLVQLCALVACTGYFIQIVSFVAMLRGRNWGRILYFSWFLASFFEATAACRTRPLFLRVAAPVIFASIAFFLVRPKANRFFAAGHGRLARDGRAVPAEKINRAAASKDVANPYRSPESESIVRGSRQHGRQPPTIYRYVIVFSVALVPALIAPISLLPSLKEEASVRSLCLAFYYLAVYVAILWANADVFRRNTRDDPGWVGRGIVSIVALLVYDAIFSSLVAARSQI